MDPRREASRAQVRFRGPTASLVSHTTTSRPQESAISHEREVRGSVRSSDVPGAERACSERTHSSQERYCRPAGRARLPGMDGRACPEEDDGRLLTDLAGHRTIVRAPSRCQGLIDRSRRRDHGSCPRNGAVWPQRDRRVGLPAATQGGLGKRRGGPPRHRDLRAQSARSMPATSTGSSISWCRRNSAQAASGVLLRYCAGPSPSSCQRPAR